MVPMLTHVDNLGDLNLDMSTQEQSLETIASNTGATNTAVGTTEDAASANTVIGLLKNISNNLLSKKITLASIQFFDTEYTAVGPKIPFTEFQELPTGGTVQVAPGDVLVTIEMVTFAGGMSYPVFTMILYQGEETREFPFGGKIYTYIAKNLTFNHAFGTFFFDDSNNIVMSPKTSLILGWTEFSVLINSSFLPLKGISF